MDAALEAASKVSETERTQKGAEEAKLSVRDEFYEEYDQWVKEGRNDEASIEVGDTPVVLQKLGASNRPLYINGRDINHTLKGHAEMTDEIIKQIPRMIDNPIMVLKSRGDSHTRKRTVVIYSEMEYQSDMEIDPEHPTIGSPFLVVIQLDFGLNESRVVKDVRIIKNAYVKNKYIAKSIWNSDVLYLNEDENKTNSWILRRRLKLPLVSNHYGPIGKITETNGDVNISGGIPYKNLAGYPDTNEPPAIDDTEQDADLSAENDVEVTNDLIAVHNLSGEQLQGIIDLGGFPMPSIAVIRANQGHDRYGDVSVIFGRETIDPTTTPRNKVYGGDASFINLIIF